ncbi:hypothetical protein [Xanthomonas citri]
MKTNAGKQFVGEGFIEQSTVADNGVRLTYQSAVFGCLADERA